MCILSKKETREMDSVADMLLGWDCPGGSVRKNPCASVGDGGDTGLTHGSGRSPREGNGNPFQYSCLNGQKSLIFYSP